jgi:ribosome-binding factor A
MANPRTKARIEARILERAAIILQTEVSDPRASFITVTRVELSSDLTSGKIFYTVLGSDADRNKVARMLEDASGYLQRQIAPALKMRRTPHLRWLYDESLEHSLRMDQLIHDALERDRAINPGGAAEEGEGPLEVGGESDGDEG